MEWLVHAHNRLPADTPAAERARLRSAERTRAMELRAEGVLRKLWRIPGSAGTVALYECRDATHLHDALASLPMFPWLEVTIEPLATHPQEAQAAAELGAAALGSGAGAAAAPAAPAAEGSAAGGAASGVAGTRAPGGGHDEPVARTSTNNSEGHDEQPV